MIRFTHPIRKEVRAMFRNVKKTAGGMCCRMLISRAFNVTGAFDDCFARLQTMRCC